MMNPFMFGSFHKIYGSAKHLLLCTIQLISGLLLALVIALFIILSTPVYIFRFLVIHLAKYIRPDLGQPLDPLSVVFAGDLDSTRPPRGNYIVTLTFDGKLELAPFQKLVMDNLIQAKTRDDELKYAQLSQYPVSWLGFLFWKTDAHFDIRNHIYLHQNSKHATDIELNKLTEDLINAGHSPSRSPWEFHILHNYHNPKLHPGGMSVLILKLHHSLTDGHGIFQAFHESILGGGNLQLPKATRTRSTADFWMRLAKTLALPFTGSMELARVIWEMSRDNPLSIPDKQKAWHQLYAKSGLIPLKQLKYIRDTFSVSFTSVLLSAISAGIHEVLEGKRVNGTLRVRNEEGFIQCLSVVPLSPKTRSGRLINHLTGTLFHIPTGSFPGPVERLLGCNKALEETKDSIVPSLCSLLITCFCSHFRWLMKWQSVATGLSNFSSFDEGFVGGALGRRLLFNDTAAGVHEGETGIGFSTTSSLGYIRFAATAEKGLLSRNEMDTLLKTMEDEIHKLYSYCNHPNYAKVKGRDPHS